MLSLRAFTKDRFMLIRLQIASRQPLSGRMIAEEGEGVVFQGWLDLLRLLSEHLEPPDQGLQPEDDEEQKGRPA